VDDLPIQIRAGPEVGAMLGVRTTGTVIVAAAVQLRALVPITV
jgi:hypothetical protein